MRKPLRPAVPLVCGVTAFTIYLIPDALGLTGELAEGIWVFGTAGFAISGVLSGIRQIIAGPTPLGMALISVGTLLSVLIGLFMFGLLAFLLTGGG